MNDLKQMGLAVTLPELEGCADWLKAGARDVELQDICEPHVMDGDWRATARRTNELLAGHRGRVGVHAPFWDLSISPQDAQIRTVVQSRLMLGLDYAEEVGGTHLVIHSPFYFFGHPLVDHQAALRAQIGLAQHTLEPVLTRATALGCTLVIENILDINPLPLLSLVESFGTPAVRLSIDVGHAHIMAARGAPPAAHWLWQGRELLGHVHLQDNDGSDDAHLAPGGGTVNWAGVLRELRANGTDPRLVVEVIPGEVDRAMRWIERLDSQT